MIAFRVHCGDAMHRLEIHEDGSMHMADHNEEEVYAFVAFGAKKPKCLEIIEMYNDNPGATLHFLLPSLMVNV